MKLFYFAKRFAYNALPGAFFEKKYHRLRAFEKSLDPKLVQERLDYYCKIQQPFSVPREAVSVSSFKKDGGTEYYLDLKEHLHYFARDTKFAYQFGDDTHINNYPTLFKARPIAGQNENSILFKLNKTRHFKWVRDTKSFESKQDKAVWRGGAYLEPRKSFVRKLWDHPLCNIGQTNKPKENAPWQKGYMPIEEQLDYKFIFCPEGNDVATNLKWVLSSNSLCLMTKPTKETWFMEGSLEAGIHYAEMKEDYSNLDKIIAHYTQHPEEAEQIIRNANQFVDQFRNAELEDLLCLKVLEQYAHFSGQHAACKFG